MEIKVKNIDEHNATKKPGTIWKWNGQWYLQGQKARMAFKTKKQAKAHNVGLSN